jgi:hypothetical protein
VPLARQHAVEPIHQRRQHESEQQREYEQKQGAPQLVEQPDQQQYQCDRPGDARGATIDAEHF